MVSDSPPPTKAQVREDGGKPVKALVFRNTTTMVRAMAAEISELFRERNPGQRVRMRMSHKSGSLYLIRYISKRKYTLRVSDHKAPSGAVCDESVNIRHRRAKGERVVDAALWRALAQKGALALENGGKSKCRATD